jgi:hypothetical protein
MEESKAGEKSLGVLGATSFLVPRAKLDSQEMRAASTKHRKKQGLKSLYTEDD